MKRIAFSILASFGAGLLMAATQFPDEDSRSPHAVALALVLEKEGARIAELEQDHDAWWFDTNERQWRVRRPFEPGWIDSTHSFVVSYSVAGKDITYWNVDTQTGKVAREGETFEMR